MSRTTRRVLGVLTIPLAVATVSAASVAPASAADPTFPFDWNINARTHLKKLDQTVRIPRGTFAGSVNLTTGAMTGSITLPPATTTVQIAGVGLATATFKVVQAKPVSGSVNFANLRATATSVFNIKVTKVAPAALPSVNLVGNTCVTSKPVRVTMSGIASLTASSTFRGTYTIPPLKSCGALTTVLNQVMPGPGNTFVAVASPK